MIAYFVAFLIFVYYHEIVNFITSRNGVILMIAISFLVVADNYKLWIAMYIQQQRGGIPALPEFDEPIQGPLNQQLFVDFVIDEVIKEFPEFDAELVKEYIQPDPFTGRSEPAIACDFLSAYVGGIQSDTLDFLHEIRDRHSSIVRIFDTHLPRYLRAMKDKSRVIFKHIADHADYTVDEFIEMTKEDDFYGHYFFGRSKAILSDPRVYEASIKNRGIGWPLSKMAKHIQSDIKYALMMIRNDPSDVCHLRTEFLDNLQIAEEIVRHPTGAKSFRFMSNRVKNNKRIALIGLHYGKGEMIDYAYLSSTLRDDDDLYLLAYIKNKGKGLLFSSPRLKQKYWYLQ